jgi:hypothetical protein
MALPILISTRDVVELTVVGGNVDTNKFQQNIYYQQDATLKPIIGDELLDKLETDVVNGGFQEPYLSLVNDYIKFVLAYATAADYILTAGINVTNGGVTSYSPDNGTQATRDDVNILSVNVKNKSEHYGQMLIDYLEKNRSSFPEYKGSSTNSNFNGWQLDNGYGCNY